LTIAAIDMGSNSFHLLIAEVDQSTWRTCFVTERKVQLAAGSETGILQAAAQQRALECLAEFKNIISSYAAMSIHVVATASLRGMRNAKGFCEQVQQLLGVMPEIVSGELEAELVYLGVCGADADTSTGQLVVDIGGGSTELAFGHTGTMARGRSVAVGCLSYLRYFPGGRLGRAEFEAAYNAARQEFDRAVAELALPEQTAVIGCSGTLLAVEQVLVTRGEHSRGIYRRDLQRLALDLQGFSRLDLVAFAGLPADRQSIFGSGLAIVLALFDALNIEKISVSERGLREGILERCLLVGTV
jgi:exopolyphosphatase/guanosine-5'-triphosphate,3'-diphosphate pyrophosphatase